MTNCHFEETRAGYISKATAMRLVLRNYRERGDEYNATKIIAKIICDNGLSAE